MKAVSHKRATACQIDMHFQDLIKDAWKHYRKSYKDCQKHYSEDTVHQLRVESRRMLALLSLVQPLLGEALISPSYRLIKKQLKQLARLRDTQVQLIQVECKLRNFPENKAFSKALRQRERRLIRRVRNQMRGPLYERIKSAVANVRSEVEIKLADSRLEQDYWKKVFRAVRQAFLKTARLRANCHSGDLETLHRLRIALKKFRYMIGLLQPVLPRSSTLTLNSLRSLQNQIGQIQDAQVMIKTLDKFSIKKPDQVNSTKAFRQHMERRLKGLVARFFSNLPTLQEFQDSQSSLKSPPQSKRALRIPRLKAS